MTTYTEPDDGLRLPLTRDPLASALKAFQTAQAAYLAEEALVKKSWAASDVWSIRKSGKLEHLEDVRDKAAVRVAVIVSERGGVSNQLTAI